MEEIRNSIMCVYRLMCINCKKMIDRDTERERDRQTDTIGQPREKEGGGTYRCINIYLKNEIDLNILHKQGCVYPKFIIQSCIYFNVKLHILDRLYIDHQVKILQTL